MNKIEHILSQLEKKRDEAAEEYKDNKDAHHWVVKPLDEKIKFFKWLLEELEKDYYYEIHYEKVRPDVWGRGDVTYGINVQVRGESLRSDGDGFKAYDTATVLIFKYPERRPEVDD